MNWLKSNQLWLCLGLYALFAILVIVIFSGTGDSGDSVLHFLYAESAPKHPELYFNHWGKPVFTLLASPFAQFGFVGMKIFNSLVVLLTLYFTFRTAEGLNLKRSILTILFIACSPLLILHTFSGLTEPLFSLFIAIGLYLTVKKKWLAACIIISFLPFVRSEGLITMSAFGLYFLFQKQWKLLPWLAFGHVVYSIIGAFYYGDLLWVFTKIPYASTTSIYGSGDLFRFVDQLPFVVGIPSAVLLGVGVVVSTWNVLRRKFNPEMHLIVLFGFLSYFIAHSLFWYLGIFNSMGLNRVLLGVMPFMAILALVGANALVDLAKSGKIQTVIAVVVAGLILIFPVLDNPSSVHWKRDMNLSGEQKVAKQIAEFVINTEGREHRFIYAPPYLSVALQIDHFDKQKRMDINAEFMQYIKSGDIIIWDSWFSVVDSHVPKELLQKQDNLRELKSFKGMQQDREVIYTAYLVE